jgi:hypothetical protein
MRERYGPSAAEKVATPADCDRERHACDGEFESRRYIYISGERERNVEHERDVVREWNDRRHKRDGDD